MNVQVDVHEPISFWRRLILDSLWCFWEDALYNVLVLSGVGF